MPSFSTRPRREAPSGDTAAQELAALPLLRLAGLLTEAGPLSDILRRAAALIPAMLPVNLAVIFRTEPATGADRLVAEAGDQPSLTRLAAWLRQRDAGDLPAALTGDEVSDLVASLDTLGFVVIEAAATTAPFARSLLESLALERLLVLPLRHGDSRVGLLLLGARGRREFDAGQLGLARGIADQVSLVVTTGRLRDENARRTRELAALHSAALATGGALDDESALRTICDQAARAFDADLAGIYLLEGQRELRGAFLGGETRTAEEVARWQRARFPIERPGFLQDLWRAGAGRVVQFQEIPAPEQAPVAHRLGLRSLLAVPLRADGIPIGMLIVGDRRAGLFTHADLPLAEALVEHAAAAISRGRAYAETEEARERVRRQLDFTLAITDTLSGGLCAVDGTGRITFANPAAERLLGWPATDLLGRDLHDLLHAGCTTVLHEEPAGCPMLQPLATGEVVRVDDDRFCRHDGEPIPVAYTASAIVTLGAIDGAVLSFTDMTARKAAEAALQASEQRYREVVENAADMIHATDVAGNYLFANPTAVLSTGYTLEEYRRMNYLDLILPEHQFRVRTHYTRQYLGREPVTLVEFPYRTKSGEVRWVAQSASLRFEGGKITGFNLIGRDITDRKLVEAELERTAAQNLAQKTELEGIITHLGDGLMLADSFGRVTLVNPAACDLLGIAPGEAAVSRPEAEYWHAITSEGKPVAADQLPLARALAGERVAAWDMTVVVDGDTRVLSVSGSPLWTPEGSLHGAVAVLRDVTDMRRTHDRFVQNERLRAVGEMASGVAHDFNNLLAVILGRCELLLDDPRTPNRDDLQIIKQAAVDGAETVKRLQAMSGVRRSSPAGEIELAAIFRDVVEYTRPRWKDAAQQRGVTIEIETAIAPLPSLQGSPAELREVLVNLIFNAVDAMPEGGTILIAAGRRGDDVWIQVADTGVGMSDEVQQRIFEPFFTTKGMRGAGLGLSMTYGIIDRMGGRIEVESMPHTGTTFTILLPYRPATATSSAPAAAPLPALSILLVDDEVEVLSTTRKMLERDGHRVTVADSGADALAILSGAGGAFDLILTDLGMPDMNGLQMIAAVRAAGISVPCVLATGWGMELTTEQVRTAGADEMLAKPFSAADLRAALTAAVGRTTPPA